MSLQPHRSMLYMPGSNARALQKAPSLGADTLILDLEDAVAPDSKQEARDLVQQTVASGNLAAKDVLVRVNSLDTPWGFADIATIAALAIQGIVLPKVDDLNSLHAAIATIDDAGGKALPVWIMTETPRGVLSADEIYGGSQRIAGVILGTSDLAKELRIPHTADRLGFLHLLSHCVLAARAHGLDIIDGVHLNFRDLDEFKAHCQQGLSLGFDGKSLIHPQQIAICNEVFTPSEAAGHNARKVLQAWEEAQSKGEGVCVVGGKLIENLHVEEAERVLLLLEAIEQRQGNCSTN